MHEHGEFSDPPKTLWQTEGGQAGDRRMTLLADFDFLDPDKKLWRAPKGYEKMDGASIPQPLWSLIGSPYTGNYRRAAIVHDWACDNLNDRLAADRMFYHACRAGRCTIWQATILYIGVRIGAWLKSHPTSRFAAVPEFAGPRVFQTRDEADLVSTFQTTAEFVLRPGETDNPSEIEQRTNVAIGIFLGK